jgi:hypothetical protein
LDSKDNMESWMGPGAHAALAVDRVRLGCAGVDVVVQEAKELDATTMSRGFLGLCADLGLEPSAEETD